MSLGKQVTAIYRPLGVCPIYFDARKCDKSQLVGNAELAGTVPMWQWIGDEGATTFSY